MSRRIRDNIKTGKPETMAAAARRIAESVEDGWCADILDGGRVLVPMPRSKPLRKDALWPPKMIAEALVAAKLGREVQTLLERTERVDKSAYAAPGQRVSLTRHIETIRVTATELDLLQPRHFLLVDDVITLGTTLAAGAHLLREFYANADIVAFALLRTNSFTAVGDQIIQPVRNWIDYDLASNYASRKP